MSKCVIVDRRADEGTVTALADMEYAVIPTMKLDCLYDAIATHADIQIHYLGHSRFVCAPETYDYYRQRLPETLGLIKGSIKLSGKYPLDVPYNAARVGKYVICRPDTIADVIKTSSDVIDVRQGYAKCSVCVVCSGAVITADRGIADAARLRGIDVLEISAGHVELRNMNYGFIGGASGLLEENLLAFNGELSTHPDGERIREFCSNHGTDIVELKKGALTDIGSVISAVDAGY